MEQPNLTLARNETYDALNLYEQWRYKENQKHEKQAWLHVLETFSRYKDAGGTMSLDAMQISLPDYLYNDCCGM